MTLACRDLGLHFARDGRRRTLAEHVDAELRPAALTCLLGPNGTGKTTLIRTLAGLHKPQAGLVLLDGRPMTAYARAELARNLAVVLTDAIGDVDLKLHELVALGRIPHLNRLARMRAEDFAAVDQALSLMHVDGLANRRVSTLSDGERQRGMIARALAQDTPLILLDEPTAFLDLPARTAMLDVLRDLAHTHKKTLLVSTHDVELATEVADELWLFPNGGPLRTGAPEELILNGELARLFENSSVRFDAEQGRFRMPPRPTKTTVRLGGEGARVHWTAHALRRAGYEPGDAGPRVNCGDADWALSAGDDVRRFERLADLLAALE